MSHTRRTKVRQWVYNHTPLWFRLHSFELFTALLCVLGGIPLLLGKTDPGSLEAAMPSTFILVWGVMLVAGPAAILPGLILANRAELEEDEIFWRRVEAWGLSALAYSAYIYAFVAMFTNFQTGFVAGLLILDFGFTCHIRELEIMLRIANVRLKAGLDERP